MAVALVEATLPFLQPITADMVRVQLLTGARPGEICVMRACDIDMSGTVWLYRPEGHKTAHHGHGRVIPIGPRARAIVRGYLNLDTQAFLFSPKQVVEEKHAAARDRRKIRVQPSQRNRKKRKPRRQPGDRYTTASYGHGIKRACTLADTAGRAEAIKNGMAPEEAEGKIFVPH